MDGICSLFELCNPQMLSDYSLSRNVKLREINRQIYTNRQIDGQIDKYVDRYIDRQIHLYRQIYRQTDRYIYTDRQIAIQIYTN